MVIGIANIIPGLSGGTMAVVLGVYHRLIGSLSSVFRLEKSKFNQSLLLLLRIGLGAIIGVYFFSYVLDWLLFNYAEPISYFFIGTILSSVPYIMRSESLELKSLSGFVCVVVMFILGLCFVGLKQELILDDVMTPSVVMLFVSACFAAGAMIIPGISGSLVFVLFGTYNVVIFSIKSLQLDYLIIIAGGALLGLIITAMTLNVALKRYFNQTMLGVLGLMLGTLPGLYVGFTPSLGLLNGVGLLFGAGVIWLALFFQKS